MNAVATFTNDETQMQVNVYANTSMIGHYNVCLKDLDSGETVPYVKIYNNIDSAIAAAKDLV